MTLRSRIAGLVLLFAAINASAQTHFKFVRLVSVPAPAPQAFAVVDESILLNTRPDVGDMRLYSDSGREVQYVLRTQRAARYSSWVAAGVLNKGTMQDETRFTVEVDVPEYDGIQLDLATKDFVAKATVEGADESASTAWNNLGAYSLYDFSKEKLGSNKDIRLPTPARYRYLRITIAGGVTPADVRSVNIANFQESKAQYAQLSAQARLSQRGNHTVVSWETSDRLPLERILIEVDPSEVNFSRSATLFCSGGWPRLTADRDDERNIGDYELSRVRLVRKGRSIESESLQIDLWGHRCKSYRIDIFNGDNPPLRILAVKPMMLERRIYFDPKNETGFKLYYGDEKANAPVYDYSKFFEPADADKVTQAALQAQANNPSFTERPDDRPFSERYPAVLWVAMILAVGLLGAWALKGFKS